MACTDGILNPGYDAYFLVIFKRPTRESIEDNDILVLLTNILTSDKKFSLIEARGISSDMSKTGGLPGLGT